MTSAAPYLVVDASVSLKWALDDEEAVTEAVALRDAALDGTYLLVAPSLWLFEVVNGLLVATRRGRMDLSLAREALRLLLVLGVRLADPDPLAVFNQAHARLIAAYDAAYLALAAALGAELWTGDRRLYDAVRAEAPFVRWIGDFAVGGADTR